MTQEKFIGLDGSRVAIVLSSIRLASLASALLIRACRAVAETQLGADETFASGCCRDRNSANTRFTTDAHVGTIVRYSGEPIKQRVR